MSIDFHKLLEMEHFKNLVNEDIYAEYLANPDKMHDDLQDHGKEVLRLSWLGGVIDGGYVQLLQWHGFYFVDSPDVECEGPIDSLEDALGGNFDHYVPQPELDSDVLTSDRLKQIALAIVDPNGEEPIKINGCEYILKDVELIEVKK